jgi:hypothetical protein
MDSLAEDLIPLEMVPLDLTPYQFFLNWFNKLPSNTKRGKHKKG